MERRKREFVLGQFNEKRGSIQALAALVTRAREQYEAATRECTVAVDEDGRGAEELLSDLNAEVASLNTRTLPELMQKKTGLENEENSLNSESASAQNKVKALRDQMGEIVAAGDLLKSRNERREDIWQKEVRTFLFSQGSGTGASGGSTTATGCSSALSGVWQSIIAEELDPQHRALLQRQEYAMTAEGGSAASGGSKKKTNNPSSEALSLVALQQHDAKIGQALQQVALKQGMRVQQLQRKQNAEQQALRDKQQNLGKQAQEARVTCETAKARERELRNRKTQLQTELNGYGKFQREYEQVKEELGRTQQMTQSAVQETQSRKVDLEKEVTNLRKQKHELQFQFQEQQDKIQSLEMMAKQMVEVGIYRQSCTDKKRELSEREAELKNLLLLEGEGGLMSLSARSGATSLIFGPTQRQQLADMIGKPGSGADSVVAEARNLENSVSVAITQNKEELTKMQQEQSQIAAANEFGAKELASITKQVAKMTNTLETHCGDSTATLEQKLEEKRTQHEQHQAAMHILSNGDMLWRQLEEKSLKKGCCELCTKRFENDAERKAMSAQVEKLRSRISRQKAGQNDSISGGGQPGSGTATRMETKGRQLMQEISELENCRGLFSQRQELRMRETTEKEAEGIRAARTQDLKSRISELQLTLQKLSSDLDALRGIVTSCDVCRRVENELKDAERLLQDRELSLASSSFSAAEGEPDAETRLAQEREKQSMLFEKSNTLERTLDQKQQQLAQAQEEESRRRQRVADMQSRFNLLQEKMTRKDDLTRQITQTEAELANAQKQAAELATTAEELEKSLAAQEVALRATEAKDRDLIATMERQQTDLQNRIERLREICVDIEKLETQVRSAEGTRGELQKYEKKANDLVLAIQQNKKNKDAIVQEVEHIKGKVALLERNVAVYRCKCDLLNTEQKLRTADDVAELRRVYIRAWAISRGEIGGGGATGSTPGASADEGATPGGGLLSGGFTPGATPGVTPREQGGLNAFSAAATPRNMIPFPEPTPQELNNPPSDAQLMPPEIAHLFAVHERSLGAGANNNNNNVLQQPRSPLMQQLNEAENLLLRKFQDRETKLKEDRGKIQGSLFQIGQSLDLSQKEEASTLYQNIDERYRQSIVKEQSAKTGADDLNKIMKSLDAALMRFHQEKMEEINFSMRSLWQEIYKGKDIEYVQIRSDVENENGEGEAPAPTTRRAGARSYNYRVVMVLANGTELDMRGRCSAGQKVLASLITRLALADSFGCQCGVLALDEPTTNLDQKNINALAEALADLIEHRRQHLGFQLMIITHDVQFVQMLSKKQFCERYWRISKDPHNGTSLITQHKMTELDQK
ncbi:unnamed protein product [Amoebophrya sp. A25]|nr:unnamed protein product [Amoebophrya sp. A25]|eukprot:GSA25T00016300001.1